MQHREEGPPTVAAPIGREGAKLLQRFNELGSANRKRLLSTALGMIERQREERLSARDREAHAQVEKVIHHLDLLADPSNTDELHRAIWRDVLADARASLARMGITYFGGIAHA